MSANNLTNRVLSLSRGWSRASVASCGVCALLAVMEYARHQWLSCSLVCVCLLNVMIRLFVCLQ